MRVICIYVKQTIRGRVETNGNVIGAENAIGAIDRQNSSKDSGLEHSRSEEKRAQLHRLLAKLTALNLFKVGEKYLYRFANDYI